MSVKGNGARNQMNQCMCLGGSLNSSSKPGSKIDIRDHTWITICINPRIFQMKSNASQKMSQLSLFTFPATNDLDECDISLWCCWHGHQHPTTNRWEAACTQLSPLHRLGGAARVAQICTCPPRPHRQKLITHDHSESVENMLSGTCLTCRCSLLPCWFGVGSVLVYFRLSMCILGNYGALSPHPLLPNESEWW